MESSSRAALAEQLAAAPRPVRPAPVVVAVVRPPWLVRIDRAR